jgi:hypothetical protein
MGRLPGYRTGPLSVTGTELAKFASVQELLAMTVARGHNPVARSRAQYVAVIVQGSKGGMRTNNKK